MRLRVTTPLSIVIDEDAVEIVSAKHGSEPARAARGSMPLWTNRSTRRSGRPTRSIWYWPSSPVCQISCRIRCRR